MSDIKHVARALRSNLTESERKIWQSLRKKQCQGLRFRRQVPIGKYIVDFACLDKKIILEINGGQHSLEKDKRRDDYLRSQGFFVMHFWNHDVLSNLSGVLKTIEQTINIAHPHPDLPPSEGRNKGKKPCV